jgi:hypothetical protein
MRWSVFLVLAYLTLAVQTTLVQWLRLDAGAAGTVQPDLLAVLAVFVALFARSSLDAMLSSMALGLAVDLTAGEITRGFAVGVMPVAYALAAGAVYRLKEAFFRDRVSTRFALTLVFCLLAHPLWVTVQAALDWRRNTWGGLGLTLLQAVLLSLYTAVLAPALLWILARAEGLVWGGQPAGRGRR